MQYCIDVLGHTRDDAQKLVLSVSTVRPVETVKLGDVQLVRGFRAANRSASAPILEVKPFQQACEASATCGCMGCGDHCDCLINVQCRLGGGRRCSGNECTCTHTAGVLSPGRWYVGVDAAGPFSLQAWLVTPVQLRSGDRLQRELVALEAQAAHSADGSAWSEYFWLDAPPHESLTLQADLARSGAPAGWVDVYLRFGEWPTTQLFDASMTTNPHATSGSSSPGSPQFVLQAERLLNQRVYVMVLAQGGSAIEYRLTVDTRPNLPLLLVCGGMFALGLFVIVLVARRWLRRAEYKGLP